MRRDRYGKLVIFSLICVGALVRAEALGGVRAGEVRPPILDKDKLLAAQTFRDDLDDDWYKANIPFFECPDQAINTTYYYRWELITKHLTYGSTKSGYVFTEFIDRPPWSGTYGAISCPAGHQIDETRWLRDPRYAGDYARYWFHTPGAEPRRYSTWLASAIFGLGLVHPSIVADPKIWLADLKANYEGWERERFDPEVGLFWQSGHDDGMETNINSRQTVDWFRGAPGYRPALNSYMYADALAIARLADRAGDAETAAAYRAKAESLKRNVQTKLWDPKRTFFFHMYKNNETKNGHTIKAGSLTYQTGEFAGSDRGRELIGYIPWCFNLPDRGFESAWRYLMDRDSFFAPFGPTTAERKDPLFTISKTCCVWSGQSWPYATSQTLKALANLLQDDSQNIVAKSDYLKLLLAYTHTQRKNGAPYIAEAANPDTGSWSGHDTYNHSEHYFHSSYNDLIITGLVGLRPREDRTVEVRPLAPESWPYFALDDVMYKKHRLSMIWDKDGTRYRQGKGLSIFSDGVKIASSERLEPTFAKLDEATEISSRATEANDVNLAVNNDGTYYPRFKASYTAAGTSTAAAIDGVRWYHVDPPNRWTCLNSPSPKVDLEIDFGVERSIHTVKLYLLDDGRSIVPPRRVDLEYWTGDSWKTIANQTRTPDIPRGRRANVIRFDPIKTSKVRAIFTHHGTDRSGLSEFEIWGDSAQSLDPAPPPTGNLAFNPGTQPYPKVSASFTSQFDKIERVNNGLIQFRPNPPDRWTAYESPNASDSLEVDFGGERSIARVELAIYDDRGGVQPPESYEIERWDGSKWLAIEGVEKNPPRPTGGAINEARFPPIKTSKIRVTFKHKGRARSGLSEILVWPE
jgi:hypothetical protein